jgi:hypothetical protein
MKSEAKLFASLFELGTFPRLLFSHIGFVTKFHIRFETHFYILFVCLLQLTFVDKFWSKNVDDSLGLEVREN